MSRGALALTWLVAAGCAQLLEVSQFEPRVESSDGGAGGDGGSGGPHGNECSADAECPTAVAPCRLASCDAGVCVEVLAPIGAPCGAEARCDDVGMCVLEAGAECVSAQECASGTCSDGRCCDTSCGVCASCAEPGFEGTCRALPSGAIEPGGACFDKRCDGLGRCATGSPKGAFITGKSPGSDRFTAGARTSDGGWFVGGVQAGAFGPFQGGNVDALVARWSPGGMVKVPVNLGSVGDEAVLAVAVDAKDEGYAVGFCSPGLVFPDPKSTPCLGPQRNAMAFKVDLAGNVAWAQVVDATTENDSLNDVALVDGTALVAVGEAGVNNFGGTRRARIVKLGLDGTTQWSREFVSSQSYFALRALDVAPDGDLVVAGILRGAANVGSATLVAANFDDVAVLRLSPNADVVRWVRVFGGAQAEQVFDVALAPDGSLAVVGQFAYDMAVDKNLALKGGDASDGYVVVMDAANGELRWASPLVGSADLLVLRGAFDAASNLVVGGTFIGPSGAIGKLGLFGQDVSTVGGYDGFIAKATSKGAALWRSVIGGVGNDYSFALKADNDTLYLLGSTSGGFVFGGVQVKTADTLEDGALFAFAP